MLIGFELVPHHPNWGVSTQVDPPQFCVCTTLDTWQASDSVLCRVICEPQQAWHSHETDVFKVDGYTRTIRGMHVYDSIIVFDEDVVQQPTHERIGLQAM